MHPHLTHVFSLLDASRAQVKAAVDIVPEGRRRERPAPDRWSAAEIIEHLALVERRFTGVVAVAIAKARDAGLAQETSARTPFPQEHAHRLLDRSVQRTAPEMVQPTGSMDVSSAWTAFDEAGAGLRDAVSAADGLALSGVTSDHHIWGPLNVYQWVELAAGHELRHADQIREIAKKWAVGSGQ
jgi:hypothetical protein